MLTQSTKLLIVETSPSDVHHWDMLISSIPYQIINPPLDNIWLHYTNNPLLILIVATSDNNQGLLICREILDQRIPLSIIFMSDCGDDIREAIKLGASNGILMDSQKEYLKYLPTLIKSTLEKESSSNKTVQTSVLTLLQQSVLEIIEGSHDVYVVLKRIMQRAITLLDADRGGGIYLYDEAQNGLVLTECSGINEGREGLVIQLGAGVTGRVFQTQKPLVVNDYSNWEGQITILAASPSSAVLGVPMSVQDHIIGVLALFANSERRIFDDEDIQVAEMFAAHAALAYQNTKLFEAAKLELTARSNAELELRQSEARYRLVVTNLPVVVFMLDEKGIFTLSEGKGLEQLSLSPGQVVGQSVLDVYADVPAIGDFLRRALTGASFTDIIAVGNQVFETWVSSILDQQGKIDYILGVAINITEQKRIEQELREAYATSQRYINTTASILVSLDHKGDIVLINPAGCRLLGYSEENLVGKNWFDTCLPEETREIVKDAFDKIIAGELDALKHYENEVVTKSGNRRLIAWHNSLLYEETTGDIVGTLSSGEDITERKIAEQQAFQLRLQRRRTEILSHFIEGALHEFRTPLSVIKFDLYSLQSIAATEHLDIISHIETQTELILQLVEELALMAELDSGAEFLREPVNIGQLLHEIWISMQAAARQKNIHVRLELENPLPEIMGDFAKLSLAIRAILDNSLHFTPVQGKIDITTSSSTDQLNVEIKDNGFGIAPNDLPHVFERFYRADKSRTTAGFGLGLPVAKSFLDIHHGKISIESTPNQGTSVTISLPLNSPNSVI